MKVQSLCVMRWNGDTPDAVILEGGYNLAEYNFFQKGRYVVDAFCGKKRGGRARRRGL